MNFTLSPQRVAWVVLAIVLGAILGAMIASLLPPASYLAVAPIGLAVGMSLRILTSPQNIK